jgi:hypothetical protein
MVIPHHFKSEILSGKRKLSLSMIRALREKLNISADILIQLIKLGLNEKRNSWL